MNKAELIHKIAKDSKITKAQANRAIDSFIDGISKGLKKGEKTSLVGFGTWYTARRKARTGRNPQTGEPIKIPAKKVVKWNSGKWLKDYIR
jgi:DNA-binding protein HU-beta